MVVNWIDSFALCLFGNWTESIKKKTRLPVFPLIVWQLLMTTSERTREVTPWRVSKQKWLSRCWNLFTHRDGCSGPLLWILCISFLTTVAVKGPFVPPRTAFPDQTTYWILGFAFSSPWRMFTTPAYKLPPLIYGHSHVLWQIRVKPPTSVRSGLL